MDNVKNDLFIISFCFKFRNNASRSCIRMYAPAHTKSAAKLQQIFGIHKDLTIKIKFICIFNEKSLVFAQKNYATREDGVIDKSPFLCYGFPVNGTPRELLG